jgi:lysozyme
MQLSAKGLQFIADQEGCRLTAYRDGGGVPTIGYGHTRGVKMEDTCTREHALNWLQEDALDAQLNVSALVSVPLTQNQYDALVDFVFNVGTHAFRKSTLLRYLNDGSMLDAANEFRRWRFDNGVEVPGLLNRRIRERQLFETP